MNQREAVLEGARMDCAQILSSARRNVEEMYKTLSDTRHSLNAAEISFQTYQNELARTQAPVTAKEQAEREKEAYQQGREDATAVIDGRLVQFERVKLTLKFCEGVTDEQLTEMIAACQTKQPLVEFVSKTDHHIEELTTKNRVLGTLAKAVISLR